MPLSLQAAWQGTVNRWGYFGDLSAGVIYEWHEKQSAEFSLGSYQVGRSNRWQSNLAYRYSPWERALGKGVWIPVETGAFLLLALDRDRTFLESPEKYPGDDYYDQTALRWGVEFGSRLQFPGWKFALAYHVRILDSGLIADYNNAHKDLVYHLSSGLSVRFLY